jgi:hypothetical protein
MRLLHTKLGIKKTRCVFVFFMVNVCVYETVYEGTVESERRIYKDKEIGFVRVCTPYVCNFRNVRLLGVRWISFDNILILNNVYNRMRFLYLV